jgi:hypothetical protein
MVDHKVAEYQDTAGMKALQGIGHRGDVHALLHEKAINVLEFQGAFRKVGVNIYLPLGISEIFFDTLSLWDKLSSNHVWFSIRRDKISHPQVPTGKM